jgi:catechol 2,3-dioxygenase
MLPAELPEIVAMSSPSEAPLAPRHPKLRIGRVSLVVNDLAGVSAFYQRAIGLQILRAEAGSAALGAGAAILLELREDKAAPRAAQHSAGLFHTAFLLPGRADLGSWMRHALIQDIALQGASDHLVSEAVYLADPEGNGIEVYADRPREQWRWNDGRIAMTTEPLDVEALLNAAAPQTWRAVPDGTTIGHVHLQVGDIARAEAFYAGTLGMDITTRYPGGSFYSTGGYHHHLATNIWNSRGAPVRSVPSTGLASVELLASDAAIAATTLHDPWGTEIRIAPG